MAQDAPRRRRARPVCDAPITGLRAGAETIARGWLIALLEDAPLADATGIPGASFAVEAPRFCEAALCAIADDRELARCATLAGSMCAMTGATGSAGALHAVDALTDVLWTALRGELTAAAPELAMEVGQRLALVGAVIRDAALEGAADGSAPAARDGARASAVAGPAAPGAPVASPSAPPSELDSPEPRRPTPAVPPRRPAPSGSGAPLWVSALADEVHDARVSGRSLALLLAELEDADRVLASAPAERAATAFGDFVTALRGALREQDVLVCEADARAWVIARDTARAAAHSLAARIAEAVGETTSSLSGAPLVASIGIAVLGEDGSDGESLAEAAEEARFSASARGIEVSRRVPEL